MGDLIDRFGKSFPKLAKAMSEIKLRMSPTDFALHLQMAESNVMNLAVRRMNAAGIDTIRIHDEVIIERRKEKKAWRIWKEVMDDQFGDFIY